MTRKYSTTNLKYNVYLVLTCDIDIGCVGDKMLIGTTDNKVVADSYRGKKTEDGYFIIKENQIEILTDKFEDSVFSKKRKIPTQWP